MTKARAALPARSCAECGASFIPSRDDARFCPKPVGARWSPCAKAFGNRNTSQGGALVPLVKAWARTRHAQPGTREAAVNTFARREMTSIAAALNDLDIEEGRDVIAYVESLMAGGTRYMDRTRR